MKLFRVSLLLILSLNVLHSQNSVQYLNAVRIFFPFSFPNGCNITVNAGPDITICAGIGKNLNGMVSGGFSSYSWEPADGLSNPDVLNPLANPMSTTTYTLIAMGTSPNLFLNGGFENGSIAPSTSSYTLHTNPNTFGLSTGGYMVMSVPQIAAAFGCNPGIGAFAMVITPTSPNTNILCQTITVTPNTEYKIDYKVFGVPYILGSPPDIRLKINGNTIGSVPAESGVCTEAEGNFMWNSGASTSANICFDNIGGTGNFSMCALDDIRFRECCVEKDEVTVTVYELMADIAQPDEISCNNRPITLDGSASSSGPGISYQWTTTNGVILRGDKTNKAVVDAPGTYKLKVLGPFGCEQEVSITVTGNVTPPDLSTSKIDIDCKNPTGRIEAKSKNPGVTFEWNGPGGYTNSRAFDNNIREPGDYEVTVTDDYGCKSTGKVVVDDKRTTVDISIKGDTIRCGQDSIKLVGNSLSPKPDYEWTLPNGTKIKLKEIVVRDTGWHKLLVRDSLGCFILDSFFVFNYKQNVPVRFLADTLNCTRDSIEIRYTTDTSGTVLWTGPKNFQSNSKKPMVRDSGWYYISLLTKDGCIGNDSVYVAADFIKPDLSVNTRTDTINCNKRSIPLIALSQTINPNFTWTGPNGFNSNNAQISASLPGTYYVIVTAANGCKDSTNVELFQDIDSISLNSYTDTINCLRDSVILSLNSNTDHTYEWVGPNGFVSTLNQPITKLPGIYSLNLTSKNGCVSRAQVEIIEDKQKPQVQLKDDTLTCSKNTLKPYVLTDPDILIFDWTGPGNFKSTLQFPDIFLPGSYTLRVVKSNGCEANALMDVFEDKVKPTATIEADTITCKSVAQLRLLSISPSTTFTWFGPGGFTSMLNTTPVTIGGWYYIELIGPNGCIHTDSILVFQKDQLPDIFTKNDTLDCTKSTVALSGGSGVQGARFEWTGPNGFFSTQQNPMVSDSGVYTLKVIDPNGCEASKSLQILKLSDVPKISINQLDSLTCKDNKTRIVLSGTSSEDQISWSGPNAFQSSLDIIDVNSGGLYIVKVTNKFGCIGMDSILITDLRSLPVIELKDDTINCLRRQLDLSLITQNTDLNFSWSGPGGFTSSLKNPKISAGGLYTVTVTNRANCQVVKSLNIAIDTLEPDLDLLADTITCIRTSAPVIAITKSQGFQISWTGPNGFRYSLPQFATSVPGIYTATLVFSRNKCSVTKSIEIVEDSSRIKSVDTRILDASCGQNNGSIAFNNINGGRPSYEFSIDGGKTFVSQNIFNQLPQGNYSGQVRDRNGCVFSLNFDIKSGNGVQISVPSEIILRQGEQQTINLTYQNTDSLKSIVWNPSDQLSCSDCINPTITGQKDQTITVTVTDKNGCTDTKDILIKILKEIEVYFPNVFSPNGDQINDYFFPVSPSNQLKLKSLSVYDRWGARIYFISNASVNNPQSGWDGRFQGQNLNPGVYLYYAEIELDGEIKTYYGEVSLLR